MAVDEALMENVREGGPAVLRVYRWSPACLSLGRNQPARGEYDERGLAGAGIDVVRRATGGRAVLHDRELTYSIALPDRVLGSPRGAYLAINRALVAALRALGVDARTHRAVTRAPTPSLAPCFQDPAEGEVVVDDRKLIGSAQFRDRGVILQHGSLLIADDQRRVATFLHDPGRRDEAPPAVLSDLLGRSPRWEDLVEALAVGFSAELAIRLRPGVLSKREAERAAILRARHEDPAWVWRL